jgi:CRISPR-associated endoribonuclease Cas6
MQSCITSFIDKALCTTDDMINFHFEDISFKNYTYTGFSEISSDKLYKAGNIYSFRLRCIGDNIKQHFMDKLPDTSTTYIKGLVCTCKTIPQGYISKLYSITPVIISNDNGYWKNTISINEFERLLFENSIKKYNAITNSKLEENFQLYDALKFINRKPIATHYKGKTLLCDKLELIINSDKRAQDISYMLLGTGICNRNSRGYGYMNYKYN